MLYPETTERFAEFVVIIALMGAGLKIDRIFNWRQWSVTWRLVAVTMPLSILAIALLAGWTMGLPWAIALLLAASLAPTDPVLAADVQVGPPKTGEEDEVRFGLTSEAGLNDGFAFPFVHLAVVLAAVAGTNQPWFFEWLGYRVLWEIGAGVAGGWLIGRLFGWLTFHVPAETKLAKNRRRPDRTRRHLRVLRPDRDHPLLRFPGGVSLRPSASATRTASMISSETCMT